MLGKRDSLRLTFEGFSFLMLMSSKKYEINFCLLCFFYSNSTETECDVTRCNIQVTLYWESQKYFPMFCPRFFWPLFANLMSGRGRCTNNKYKLVKVHTCKPDPKRLPSFLVEIWLSFLNMNILNTEVYINMYLVEINNLKWIPNFSKQWLNLEQTFLQQF